MFNLINKEMPNKAMTYFLPIKFALNQMKRPSNGKVCSKHGVGIDITFQDTSCAVPIQFSKLYISLDPMIPFLGIYSTKLGMGDWKTFM